MKDLKKRLEIRRRLGVKYVKVQGRPKVAAKSVASAPVRVTTASPKVHSVPTTLTAANSAEPLWCLGEGSHASELKAMRDKIKGCRNCPLGRTRINFVFGMGNPKAQVLFVGEAPGADEDEQGLPFVGRAGQLLTKIIESTKTWKREEVFIANVLKCRPPGNRPPQPEEVEQCLTYLKEQIRILKPRLILALGASAAQSLLSTKEAVGKLRHRWHELEGVPLLVTYHPAALLRFADYKKDVWSDMKVFTAKYKELTGS